MPRKYTSEKLAKTLNLKFVVTKKVISLINIWY